MNSKKKDIKRKENMDLNTFCSEGGVDRRGLTRGLTFTKTMGETITSQPPRQQLVYNLYNEGYKGVEIAKQLNISKQAVFNIKKKLEKKGISIGNKGGVDREGYGRGYPTKKLKSLSVGEKTVTPKLDKNLKDWRIHGLHFQVKPYYFYPKYYNILKSRGNHGIRHDKWTIILYKESIRIQSTEGIDWRHYDKYEALRIAENEFNVFLAEIAPKYGFEYQKDGRISIKLLNSHLAQMDSDFSKSVDNSEIRIKGHNGKVYFVIDQSKGEHEHEYIGSESFDKSERLEPYINDFTYNRPPSNSQLATHIYNIVEYEKRHATNIESHIQAIQELSKGVKEFSAQIKKFNQNK